MGRLADMVPDFVKPALRPLYRVVESSRLYRASLRLYSKITVRPKPRDELHQYWREPWDGGNFPQAYLEGEARSQFLVEIMQRYATRNANILEIGCNVGRNLHYLFLAGFKNLEGIEISEKAVQSLRQSYPEMARHTKVYNAPVEDMIGDFTDCQFDIVFTMAVLEHIHPDSECIFPKMVRITKDFLITIEDEHGTATWRRFPRNYKKVFQALGMKQVEEINCSEVDRLNANFFARVFKKT